jgi:anthranilate phosphoribosyltransferase
VREFPTVLTPVLEGREVAPQALTQLLRAILAGELGEAETAAFLIALRMKGETAGELAAAASLLRERMVRLETAHSGLLDTCGTGGDGCGTFNISTAVAIVAAAVGVPVVKHGNRAMSSRSGSADVSTELGLKIDSGPDWAKRCLDATGLAFCFAPHFHPALKQVSDLRRRLGVRTIFNLIGPLANPAGADYQLLGVGKADLLDPLAGALAKLGTKQAYLVCGRDALDEVSLAAPTMFRQVRGDHVTAGEWTAADFGLEPCSLEDLCAADAGESAAVIREVLAGAPGPARRIVLANVAAAMLTAERVSNLRDGVSIAANTIDSGNARNLLEQVRKIV